MEDEQEPRRWPASALIWPLAGCILLAAALTALVVTENSALQSFDEAVTDFTRNWADNTEWAVQTALVIGSVTSTLPSAILGGIVVLVLFLGKHYRWALFMTVSGILGAIISAVIKIWVSRERPPSALPYESDAMLVSFPSGHTMSGIYIYAMIGVVLLLAGHRKWGAALFVIGVVIGLSRLVLGVHWPSDVIAGWAFGSAIGLFAALLVRPDYANPPGPPQQREAVEAPTAEG